MKQKKKLYLPKHHLHVKGKNTEDENSLKILNPNGAQSAKNKKSTQLKNQKSVSTNNLRIDTSESEKNETNEFIKDHNDDITDDDTKSNITDRSENLKKSKTMKNFYNKKKKILKED